MINFLTETKKGAADKKNRYEIFFLLLLHASSWLVILIVTSLFATLLIYSLPAIRKTGFSFITGKIWDPLSGEFGTLPFLAGTLITSFLALIFSLPFAISISIFSSEYYRSGKIASFLQSCVELLAGIPSVIFGFWAVTVLLPVVQKLQLFLGVTPYGVGIFTASAVLSIMIIPYAASVSREVILLVPDDLREAALSLGATKSEMILKVVLPYAGSGIFAGVLLSLGRALGETMAVTMVIGNCNILPDSIFSPGNTLASVIANEFCEATGAVYVSALAEIGLLLFVVSTIINFAGRLVIRKLRPSQGKS